MLDLLVVSDGVRRRMTASLQSQPAAPAKPVRERSRGEVVRSTSAAVLRRLAERLEPSPSH
jgi:hypothetical protein